MTPDKDEARAINSKEQFTAVHLDALEEWAASATMEGVPQLVRMAVKMARAHLSQQAEVTRALQQVRAEERGRARGLRSALEESLEAMLRTRSCFGKLCPDPDSRCGDADEHVKASIPKARQALAHYDAAEEGE